MKSANQTWKTIRRRGGGPTNTEDFLRAFKHRGIKISAWAKDILSKTIFMKQIEDVKLVQMSVSELGFASGAFSRDVYTRAQELALDLCQPEDGPWLRWQYINQPKGEWLVIAMEPIMGPLDDLLVYFVVHDEDELQLYAYDGNPEFFWVSDTVFVFRLRK